VGFEKGILLSRAEDSNQQRELATSGKLRARDRGVQGRAGKKVEDAKQKGVSARSAPDRTVFKTSQGEPRGESQREKRHREVQNLLADLYERLLDGQPKNA